MKSLKQQFKALKSQMEQRPPLEGHQLRFQRKLEQQNRPAIKLMTWISIAASFTLLLALNSATISETPKTSAPLTSSYEAQILSQLHYLETTYQEDFAIPIQDIKSQLKALDEAYIGLESQFNEQNEHPLLLKAMIDNLQQPLDILNELEQVLKARNENDYENSIL
jgi:hypothetical protein